MSEIEADSAVWRVQNRQHAHTDTCHRRVFTGWCAVINNRHTHKHTQSALSEVYAHHSDAAYIVGAHVCDKLYAIWKKSDLHATSGTIASCTRAHTNTHTHTTPAAHPAIIILIGDYVEPRPRQHSAVQHKCESERRKSRRRGYSVVIVRIACVLRACVRACSACVRFARVELYVGETCATHVLRV